MEPQLISLVLLTPATPDQSFPTLPSVRSQMSHHLEPKLFRKMKGASDLH